MVPWLGLDASGTSFQPCGSRRGPGKFHSRAPSRKLAGARSSSTHGDAVTNHRSNQRPHPFLAKLQNPMGFSSQQLCACEAVAVATAEPTFSPVAQHL